MKPELSRILRFSFASFVPFSAMAGGADLFWSGPAVTADGQYGGGGGSWSAGGGGWQDGVSAANRADGENAVFGGTAGTLTPGGNVSAGMVTLRASGCAFAKSTRT